jgi:hypothetical protein
MKGGPIAGATILSVECVENHTARVRRKEEVNNKPRPLSFPSFGQLRFLDNYGRISSGIPAASSSSCEKFTCGPRMIVQPVVVVTEA